MKVAFGCIAKEVTVSRVNIMVEKHSMLRKAGLRHQGKNKVVKLRYIVVFLQLYGSSGDNEISNAIMTTTMAEVINNSPSQRSEIRFFNIKVSVYAAIYQPRELRSIIRDLRVSETQQAVK